MTIVDNRLTVDNFRKVLDMFEWKPGTPGELHVNKMLFMQAWICLNETDVLDDFKIVTNADHWYNNGDDDAPIYLPWQVHISGVRICRDGYFEYKKVYKRDRIKLYVNNIVDSLLDKVGL